MGGKSSAPAAPDPTATAQAQSQYDKNTAAYNAALNRVNTYTPLGSQTWNQTGKDPITGAPIYSQNINLTPNAQAALDNTQQTQAGLSALQGQALGGVANTLSSNPFDRSQLPARPINAGQTAQDAIMARLQPEMNLQNQQFEADMANRGIAQGSDPYNQAKRSLTNSQNDAMIQAAATGINVGNDSRNQAIQEQLTYANAPLNYLNGLMSGAQVSTPQFQSTPSVMANAPNYAQAVGQNYQGQLNAYNTNVGSQNSFMSGLMGMAGTIGGAMIGGPAGAAVGGAAGRSLSDRRLKSNIVRVGEHPLGIGIYEYDIFGKRQRGVMADEVERVRPEAVSVHPSGFKMVDYGKL